MVRGHYLLREAKRTVFRERKTVSYEEQICLSTDPSIFLSQMEAIVFIILQIVFATSVVLKIGKYFQIFPSFSGGIFGHVTCLDQSRGSENIWWIIMLDIFCTGADLFYTRSGFGIAEYRLPFCCTWRNVLIKQDLFEVNTYSFQIWKWWKW